MKENAAPISASRTSTKVEPKKQEEQAIHIPLPTPLSEKSDSGANVAVNENDQDNERGKMLFFWLMFCLLRVSILRCNLFSFLDSVTALGPSIYLKGLPLDATPALLENEFQKFGLIRTNGIQVRSQKVKESIFTIA